VVKARGRGRGSRKTEEEVYQEKVPEELVEVTNNMESEPAATSLSHTEDHVEQQPSLSHTEDHVEQQPSLSHTEDHHNHREHQPSLSHTEDQAKQQVSLSHTEDQAKQQVSLSHTEDQAEQQVSLSHTEDQAKQQPSLSHTEDHPKEDNSDEEDDEDEDRAPKNNDGSDYEPPSDSESSDNDNGSQGDNEEGDMDNGLSKELEELGDIKEKGAPLQPRTPLDRQAKKRRKVAVPSSTGSSVQHPDFDSDGGSDDGEEVDALASESEAEEADGGYGSSSEGKEPIEDHKAPVSFNQSIIHVPYDGAMPDDELHRRLATPLNMGVVTMTEPQVALILRAVETLERTFKVYTNRSPPGSGKCWARGTRLRLLSGDTIAVEDVRGGEQLMGDDSLPRTVSPGSLTRGTDVLYRVAPTWMGASPFTVNGDHILVLRNIRRPWIEHQNSLGGLSSWSLCRFVVDSANSMTKSSLSFQVEAEAHAALATSLEQWRPLEWETTVEQYLQTSSSIRRYCRLVASNALTFVNPALPGLHQVLAGHLGVEPSTDQLHWMAWWIGVRLSDGDRFISSRQDRICKLLFHTSSVLSTVCNHYGFRDKKHLPRALICDSLSVRRHLLAGIIDGQSCRLNYRFHYYQLRADDAALVLGYKELAATLGVRNSSIFQTGLQFGLNISEDIWGTGSSVEDQYSRVYGFTIAELPVGDYFGFAVHGGINRRFLLEDYTVTHNTLTSYAIGQLLGLKLVVVHPIRVSSWREEAQRCKLEGLLYRELGYEELRSVAGQAQPKHGLLTRYDPPLVPKPVRSGGKRKKGRASDSEGSIDLEDEELKLEDEMEDVDDPSPKSTKKRARTTLIQPPPVFTATQKYLDLLNEGVLLVLDESHRSKNKASERSAAVAALVTALVTTPGHRSRCLLLSATQFDEKHHAISVCYSMGLIPSAQGGERIPRDCLLIKLAQAFEPNHELMSVKTLKRRNASNRDRLMFIYNVYIHILSPRLTSSVPRMVLPVYQDAKVGFYKMPPADELMVRRAMKRYRQAVAKGNGVNPNRLAIMGRAIEDTQLAKVSTVIRLVRAAFRENPRAAVTVMGGFLEALFKIAIGLSDLFPWTAEEQYHHVFNPRSHVLSGSLTPQEQEDTINAFQSGACSLLVANLEVGGEGINLQDKQGGRERWVFMLPNERASSMHQGLSRFFRHDTKSDVIIRVVYCRSKNRFGDFVKREQVMLRNHKRKDGIWRQLMPQQDQEGYEFLAGLEEFHEATADEADWI
jgi:hypothetical protein